MINLSKRLLAMASFVRNNAKIVDIGCDHALLDIYLKQKYSDISVIASDVRNGALNQAKENILKYNMINDIDLRLGNGLDVVCKEEIDTILISGLGCSKIVEILMKDTKKIDNVNDLIIQSNTEHGVLRKKICKLGYFIKDEMLVKENDIIYVIIHFQRGVKRYSDIDYLIGPILRDGNSDLYNEFLQNDIQKKEILYSLIPPKYFSKRERLKTLIMKLKQELR